MEGTQQTTQTSAEVTTTTTRTRRASLCQSCQTDTTSTTSRTAYFTRHLTPPELDPRTAKVVWRDLLFLALGFLATSIIGFVESHASEADARTLSVRIVGLFTVNEMPSNPNGIVDTGFILTQPIYEWLRDNRDWNDTLAALNSLVLVIPSLYIAYVTVWEGDYSLSFRVLSVQLLRAFCGWFTYLPPDPTYLNSYYDVPDVIHCLFQECAGQIPQVILFVSFFSGHVATMVVVGNHMWLNGYRQMAVLSHLLNVLQIVRLLASRGHYSIDMIIGWYVAVYVSNPAGRLGRYYSRGATVQELLPTTPQEAFETVTGVRDARNESRMSALMHRPEVQEALRALEREEAGLSCHSDTTVRILQETAAKMMQEEAQVVLEQMHKFQQQARKQAAEFLPPHDQTGKPKDQ